MTGISASVQNSADSHSIAIVPKDGGFGSKANSGDCCFWRWRPVTATTFTEKRRSVASPSGACRSRWKGSSTACPATRRRTSGPPIEIDGKTGQVPPGLERQRIEPAGICFILTDRLRTVRQGKRITRSNSPLWFAQIASVSGYNSGKVGGRGTSCQPNRNANSVRSACIRLSAMRGT